MDPIVPNVKMMITGEDEKKKICIREKVAEKEIERNRKDAEKVRDGKDREGEKKMEKVE